MASPLIGRRNDLRTGKSGEHLVLAKLTRWGFDAHDAPQDAAYDVIVDYQGRVVGLQIKTRSHAKVNTWGYRAQRGNWRSATGTYAYCSTDYDIFAAVTNGFLPVQALETAKARNVNLIDHQSIPPFSCLSACFNRMSRTGHRVGVFVLAQVHCSCFSSRFCAMRFTSPFLWICSTYARWSTEVSALNVRLRAMNPSFCKTVLGRL